MALIQYYDVPQNTFNTISLPRASYGLRIENNSNQFIAVKDDLGHIIAQCPPGISASWNALEGMHSPQIGCLGFYQGNARVYFYDSQVDTNSNPALQQPPGTVTTTDSLVETLLTTLNTLVGTTNTNTGGASTNTGTLITLINSLNNLVGTSNSLDTDIRAYLSALQGMLSQSLTVCTFTGVWQEQTIGPLATGRQQISYSVKRGTVDGTVWIAYSVGGTRTYLENRTYWGKLQPMMQAVVPLWIVVTEYIPVGATVIVGSDAACTVTVKL